MADLMTNGTYDGRNQSTWYYFHDIGVSYCPFCGSKKIEKWNSMFRLETTYKCLSCGNAFNVRKEEYMSFPKRGRDYDL